MLTTRSCDCNSSLTVAKAWCLRAALNLRPIYCMCVFHSEIYICRGAKVALILLLIDRSDRLCWHNADMFITKSWEQATDKLQISMTNEVKILRLYNLYPTSDLPGNYIVLDKTSNTTKPRYKISLKNKQYLYCCEPFFKLEN